MHRQKMNSIASKMLKYIIYMSDSLCFHGIFEVKNDPNQLSESMGLVNMNGREILCFCQGFWKGHTVM